MKSSHSKETPNLIESWKQGMLSPQIPLDERFKKMPARGKRSTLPSILSYITSAKAPFDSSESTKKELSKCFDGNDENEFSIIVKEYQKKHDERQLSTPASTQDSQESCVLPQTPCGRENVLACPGVYIEGNILSLEYSSITIHFHESIDITDLVAKCRVKKTTDGLIEIESPNGKPVCATVVHRHTVAPNKENAQSICERNKAHLIELRSIIGMPNRYVWVYQLGKRQEAKIEKPTPRRNWKESLDIGLDFQPSLKVINPVERKALEDKRRKEIASRVSDDFMQEYKNLPAKRVQCEPAQRSPLKVAKIDFESLREAQQLASASCAPALAEDEKGFPEIDKISREVHSHPGLRVTKNQHNAFFAHVLQATDWSEHNHDMKVQITKEPLVLHGSKLEALQSNILAVFADKIHRTRGSEHKFQEIVNHFAQGMGWGALAVLYESNLHDTSTRSEHHAVGFISPVATLRLLFALMKAKDSAKAACIVDWIETICKDADTCTKCGEDRLQTELYRSIANTIDSSQENRETPSHEAKQPPNDCDCAWMRNLHAALTFCSERKEDPAAYFEIVNAILEREQNAAVQRDFAYGIIETVLTGYIEHLRAAVFAPANSSDATLAFFIALTLHTCWDLGETLGDAIQLLAAQLEREGLPNCALIAASFIPDDVARCEMVQGIDARVQENIDAI